MTNLITGHIDTGHEYLDQLHVLVEQRQLMTEACHYQIAGILARHEGDLARSETLYKPCSRIAGHLLP